MADTLSPSNPYLEGNFAPVRSEDDFDLQIEGVLPKSLRGALYRNGPNPQFDPSSNYHPFVGDGMIHGFWIADGKAHYRNRWVRTPRWLAEHEAGRPLFGGMGRPSDPKVENIHSGGANTNIVHHAGRLMALQEGSNPFGMDKATLASLGWIETGGRFTAHPKLDPKTGEMVWFAYCAGPEPLNSYLDYGVSDANGKVLRRDRFQAPFCSMVHDFLVTQNYVLFPILPLTGDFERAKKGGPAFAWEPKKGAYLGLMKRNAPVSSIRWLEVDPAYVFHPMNAWEDGSKIHCELMEYPSAPLFPNADGSPGVEAKARLTRWTLDLSAPTNMVKRETLDDVDGEFPRFDERLAGLPYRHGWYVASTEKASTLEFNALAHVDLKSGKRSLRQLGPGDSAGEPIFVPARPDAAEGEGFILAVVYRATENRSDLLVLNALDIEGEPQAVLKLPRRVPSGFHGNWVGA